MSWIGSPECKVGGRSDGLAAVEVAFIPEGPEWPSGRGQWVRFMCEPGTARDLAAQLFEYAAEADSYNRTLGEDR